MKEKKVLWGEVVASLLFLIGFFLVRFALRTLEINLGGDTLAPLLAVTVFLIATLIYLSGAEKRFLSFSFDALVLAVAGYFLWELKGVEDYSLWFSLLAFGALVLISVVNTVKMVNAGSELKDQREILLKAHSLITYGLATKVVVIGLGVVAVEKLLLPMLVY